MPHSEETIVSDEDAGDDLIEVLRREAEMENDPSMSISLEELKRSVGR